MHTSLSKLVTRSILWCAVPLILAAIYVSAVRVFDVNSASQTRASQVATNLRVALDNNLRSRIASLTLLADSADADPLDLPRLYQQALVFRTHFGGAVILADTELRMLFNSGIPLGQPVPPRLPTPPGFAAAPYAVARGEPAVGDKVFAMSSKTHIVAVAVPVVRDGQVRRLLLNTIDILWIQQLLDNLNLPPDWQISVRDGAGALLAQRPHGPLAYGEVKTWSSASEVSRWQVTVGIPASVFYRKHIETALWTLVLLLIAVGVSIQLGKRTSRTLFRAMLTLQGANHASAGSEVPAQGEAIAEVEAVRSALQAEQASRAKAEAALRESEQRWRFAIDGAGDGLWDWDMASGQVFYSSRWKSMLGYADEDIPPNIAIWGELAHPDDKQRVLDAVQQHLDGLTPEFVQEYRIRCKDGSWKWLLARGIALHDPDHPGNVRMLGVNSDITERKESEARIAYLAYYDPLTGLANRKLLADRMQQALAAAERSLQYGALLFIDLDGFKPVNDMWGHSVGDQMLVQVAQRIKQNLRTGDTVARIGGDEFVILVQNLGTQREEAAQQVAVIADKVLGSFFPPFHLGEHEFHGGASIGVALFREEHLTLDALTGQADAAMYRAKSGGGNQVRFFDTTLQATLLERSTSSSP